MTGEANPSPQAPRPKESPLVILAAFFGGVLVLISLYMTIGPAWLMWRDGSGKVALGWFLWGMLWTGYWLNMTLRGVLRTLIVTRMARANRR